MGDDKQDDTRISDVFGPLSPVLETNSMDSHQRLARFLAVSVTYIYVHVGLRLMHEVKLLSMYGKMLVFE